MKYKFDCEITGTIDQIITTLQTIAQDVPNHVPVTRGGSGGAGGGHGGASFNWKLHKQGEPNAQFTTRPS